MLQLTKRTEYGLIAMVHMAAREGEFVSVRELCERFPLPRRLLAEVLKELSRTSLIESHRGSQGGYTLGRSPDAITLGEIVAALEGEPSLTSCESSWLKTHSSRRGTCEVEPVCPIRSPINHIRQRLWRLLETTSLRSLASPAHRPLAASGANAHGGDDLAALATLPHST
jgi:Rrf2 family protein